MEADCVKKLLLSVILILAFIFSLPTAVYACFSDIQCANGGAPVAYDATHIVQDRCINGVCVMSEPVEVECTSDAACPSGYICQMGVGDDKYTCIKSGGHTPPYCGDNTCDRDETDIPDSQGYCPEDCDPNYQPPIEEQPDYTIPIVIVGIVIAMAIIGGAILVKKKK